MNEKRFRELAKECGVEKTVWVKKINEDLSLGIDVTNIIFELQSYEEIIKGGNKFLKVHGEVLFTKKNMLIMGKNPKRIKQTPKEIALLYLAWLKEIGNDN